MKSPQAPTTNTETGQPEPKRRKTYTIRKQREMWTEEEHQKFLEGLRLFDRDWRCIEEYIGTKTAAQIRSHAQKYFEKNQSASIPPAKHKRKQDRRSAGPLIIPWITAPDALSDKPYLADPTAFANWMQANGFIANQPPPGISPIQLAEMERQQSEQLKLALTQIQSAMTEANSIQSNPSDPAGGTNKPNWSQIYSYLGTLFDATPTSQAPRLAEMRAADRIVVQLLMHNLSLTLSSDDNEEYKELLQDYQDQIKGVQRQQQEEQRRRNLQSQLEQSHIQQQQQSLYMQQAHLQQQQQSLAQLQQPQQQHVTQFQQPFAQLQQPPQLQPLAQMQSAPQQQQQLQQQQLFAYMQQQHQWQSQLQQAQLQQVQQQPLTYVPQPSFTNEAGANQAIPFSMDPQSSFPFFPGMPASRPKRKKRSSRRRSSQDPSVDSLQGDESLADLMSSLSENTPAASDLPSEPEFLQTSPNQSPIPMAGLTNSQTTPPRFPNEGTRFSQPASGNSATDEGVRVPSPNQNQGTSPNQNQGTTPNHNPGTTPAGVPLILQPSLVPSIPTPTPSSRLTTSTAVNQDSPFKASSQTDSTM